MYFPRHSVTARLLRGRSHLYPWFLSSSPFAAEHFYLGSLWTLNHYENNSSSPPQSDLLPYFIFPAPSPHPAPVVRISEESCLPFLGFKVWHAPHSWRKKWELRTPTHIFLISKPSSCRWLKPRADKWFFSISYSRPLDIISKLDSTPVVKQQN